MHIDKLDGNLVNTTIDIIKPLNGNLLIKKIIRKALN